MKSFYKCILLIVLGLNNSYGQITTTIDEVFVNSQTNVTNCGTIDFGTTQDNHLVFYFTLSKSSTVQDGNLKIKLKYNSSSNGADRESLYITQNMWSGNEYIHTIATNISASEVQVSGSSIYLEFTQVSDPNTKFESCEYPITKTPLPSFTLSPTSLSLACGDTGSRTFTVTPANIPSGAAVTYNWSYSGWTQINSTATSKTLQPNSGVTLPSNVSVTPYINGVAQSTKTCTVTRSAIASSGSISGNTAICTTGTYTFNGLLADQSVTWSLSNATVATLSTTTGTTTMLTKIGNGAVTLKAKIENPCGQSYEKTIDLYIGEASPPVLLSASGVPYNSADLPLYCDQNTSWLFGVSNPLEGVIEFRFGILIKGQPITYVYKTVNNGIATISAQDLGMNTGDTRYLVVSARNSCGWGNTQSVPVYKPTPCQCGIGPGCHVQRIGSDNDNPQKNDLGFFKVFPNPANDFITIELENSNYRLITDSKIEMQLFDITGRLTQKGKLNDKLTTLDVSRLQKGIYVLKIYVNDQVESHKIVVE